MLPMGERTGAVLVEPPPLLGIPGVGTPPVQFNGSYSSDNLAVVGYQWKFFYNGTERTLTGASPTFTFWTPGDYLVTLNVTDAAGNYDTDTMSVTVQGEAIPEFSGLLLPVTMVMVAFLVLMRRSRAGSKRGGSVQKDRLELLSLHALDHGVLDGGDPEPHALGRPPWVAQPVVRASEDLAAALLE